MIKTMKGLLFIVGLAVALSFFAPADASTGKPVSLSTGVLTVVKSDTTIISCNELYVGGTGNVAVTAIDGTTAIFTAVPTGGTIRVAITQVLSTNTTATLMICLR